MSPMTTTHSLRMALRLGAPPVHALPEASPTGAVSEPLPAPPPAKNEPERHSGFELFFGILLPLISMAVEATMHWSRDSYFDPFPTPLHLMLAACLPLTNLLIWTWRWRNERALSVINGLALVVGGLYSLIYLPITPLALLGIPFMGVGLLPLAPHFALWTAVRQRRRLRAAAFPLWKAIVIGAALVMLINFPAAATIFGAMKYRTGSARERSAALWVLRTFGDSESLRRAGQGRGWPIISVWRGRVQPWEARELFFRVTGKPVDPPQMAAQLTVQHSQIDGSIDPAAQLGYLQWTMVFQNRDLVQQEARALVQLPPGAVVSRVTLWVNGEEREAAFGRKDHVQQAYEQVVAARRDPLLVTSAGPGRVQVRCFPVPPQGEMRIRLGITMPVEDARLRLPSFIEKNFAAAKHLIWIDAGSASIQKTVTDTELTDPLRLAGAAPAAFAWTPDPKAPGQFHIQQRYANVALDKPKALVIVVDGSKSLAPLGSEIRRAIDNTRAKIKTTVIVAGDEVRVEDKLRFAGGTDNVAALVRAQQIAAERNAAIVWLHGPQPVTLTGPDALTQFWTRRPGQSPLYAVQLVAGPNQVLSRIDHLREVQVVEGDVHQALNELTGATTRRIAIRERIAGAEGVGQRTSDHLARLWAASEVARTQDAKMAAAWQLVTPWSGAVVLENQRQYDAAGLTPVDPSTVPSVPEPETWALLASGIAVAAGFGWYRRRPCRRA